jgi:hypothetical protein
MKHQTTSEATPVLPPEHSTNGSVDTATLELFASWRLEDANATPEQIRAAQQDLQNFKRAMNETRTASGEPTLYP